jgi:acetyl esterase/lipase
VQKFFAAFFQKSRPFCILHGGTQAMLRLTLLSALVPLILAAGLAHAQAVQRDIPYGTAPSEVLDFYASPRNPAPLVVFVHGGGWSKGDKKGSRHLADALRDEGYAVASIDYRLLGTGATIRDQALEVMQASEFLLSHASQFGIDARRFALMGHSAGGHLVALVGADPVYAHEAGLDFGKLAVVVALDGVFNLALPTEMRHMQAPADGQGWKPISPIDRLDTPPPHPAFCLVHEDEVPRFTSQADAFAAALQAHGITETEGVSPGLNHVQLVTRFNDPSTATEGLVTGCLRRFLGP